MRKMSEDLIEKLSVLILIMVNTYLRRAICGAFLAMKRSVFVRSLVSAVLAVSAAGAMPLSAAPPRAEGWAAASLPAAGAAQAFGGYANGCIAGASALPPEGVGYQAIRLSRNRFYGHPALIDMLQDFGRHIAVAGIGVAAIGDLSQPRGGPMPSGHGSHQTGLDADIWLRLDLPLLPRNQREDLTEIPMVDAARQRVDAAQWDDRQAALVRLAAQDGRVARIFVAPPIKLALCGRDWPDRSWLRKIRPWFGHTGHMHVRLHCPAESRDCREQDPPPAGDGCGAELLSWFAPPRHPAPPAPRPRPPLPSACAAVLAAPAR